LVKSLCVTFLSNHDLELEKTQNKNVKAEEAVGEAEKEENSPYQDLIGYILLDNKKIPVFSQKDPTLLPWRDLNVDVVIESTGNFRTHEKLNSHLTAGAKRVILTAPAKDEDGIGHTVLVGINDNVLKTAVLSSNGSCTTNAASPVIQIMSENPGIEKAILNAVHGYTATQSIVDGPVKGKDFRRGRAAGD